MWIQQFGKYCAWGFSAFGNRITTNLYHPRNPSSWAIRLKAENIFL